MRVAVSCRLRIPAARPAPSGLTALPAGHAPRQFSQCKVAMIQAPHQSTLHASQSIAPRVRSKLAGCTERCRWSSAPTQRCEALCQCNSNPRPRLLAPGGAAAGLRRSRRVFTANDSGRRCRSHLTRCADTKCADTRSALSPTVTSKASTSTCIVRCAVRHRVHSPRSTARGAGATI